MFVLPCVAGRETEVLGGCRRRGNRCNSKDLNQMPEVDSVNNPLDDWNYWTTLEREEKSEAGIW